MGKVQFLIMNYSGRYETGAIPYSRWIKPGEKQNKTKQEKKKKKKKKKK